MVAWNEKILNRPKLMQLQPDLDSPLVQLLNEIVALRELVENQTPVPAGEPQDLGVLVAGLADIAASIRQAAAPGAGRLEGISLDPIIQEIRQGLKSLPPADARRDARWRFQIERDENGLLTSVVAEQITNGAIYD